MGVSVFTDGRDRSLCLLHNIKLVVKNSSNDPPPLANGLSCFFIMAACVLYVIFCMKPYSPEVWGRLASSRSTRVLKKRFTLKKQVPEDLADKLDDQKFYTLHLGKWGIMWSRFFLLLKECLVEDGQLLTGESGGSFSAVLNGYGSELTHSS